MIDLSTPHDLDPDELEYLGALKSDERARLAATVRDLLKFLSTVIRAANISDTDVKAGEAMTAKIQPGPSGLDPWIN